jgi:hypothetical protein
MEETEADCEYTEYVVAESRESVVVLLEYGTRENNFLPWK